MGKITVRPKQEQFKAYHITPEDTIVNLHSDLYKVDGIEFVCRKGAPYAGGYVIMVPGTAPEYITKEVAQKRYELVSTGW